VLMRTCLSFAEFTYIESLVLMRTCLSYRVVSAHAHLPFFRSDSHAMANRQ